MASLQESPVRGVRKPSSKQRSTALLSHALPRRPGFQGASASNVEPTSIRSCHNFSTARPPPLIYLCKSPSTQVQASARARRRRARCLQRAGLASLSVLDATGIYSLSTRYPATMSGLVSFLSRTSAASPRHSRASFNHATWSIIATFRNDGICEASLVAVRWKRSGARPCRSQSASNPSRADRRCFASRESPYDSSSILVLVEDRRRHLEDNMNAMRLQHREHAHELQR